MAYKHIVVEFDKRVLAPELSNVDISISFSEQLVINNDYSSPVEFTPVSIELYTDKSIIIGFDHYLNNVIGNIRVKYTEGLLGIDGSMVEPFTIDFVPYDMTFLPVPASVDGIRYSNSSNIVINSIGATSASISGDNVSIPAISTNSIIVTAVSFKQPNVSDITAININDTTIRLSIPAEYYLTDGVEKQLTIQAGAYGIPVPILSVSKVGTYTNIICSKFNNYTGNFKVSYNGNGAILLTSGTPMVSFETEFTPLGLAPDDIEAPVLITAINMEVQ